MSPLKRAAVKGGNSKGKDHVIDVDDLYPKLKRNRSSSGVYDPNKFKTYASFQTHEKYFREVKPLLERVLDQSSLSDTDILKWFVIKDWNYLLSTLDDAYENLVKELYANVIVEGEELKCWVRGKTFFVTPAYLAKILHINRPMLRKPLVYDDLFPEEDLLREALGKDLEFSPNGNSINVSSLSPELKVLTIIMFHNLYPLSSIGYMNLGRALFLHNLISDVKIDICAHIFHILCKTIVRTDSRICVPFCCLILQILKLKGIYLSADESSHPKPSPINLWTLNASIGHSKKGVKSESQTSHSGSHSILHSCDEKLDYIIASIHDLSTQMSGLASLLHHHTIRCDMKFTSLQT